MLRVLVVDDEPLCRMAVSVLLEQRDDIAECHFANDGFEAIERLSKHVYDVLLLDINMPALSGLEFIERLQNSHQRIPAIIFITAHNEHAIAAFEKRAVDYILKPFAKERVNEALDRARRALAAERAAAVMESLAELKIGTNTKRNRIAVKTQSQIILIDPTEVLAVEADGNYVVLHRKSGSNLVRDSISAVADKLKPYGFVRIHRSILVNSAHVDCFAPLFSGEYSVTMRGGKRFTASRTFKNNLQSFAGLGIGS